jgi:hypothetical protein
MHTLTHAHTNALHYTHMQATGGLYRASAGCEYLGWGERSRVGRGGVGITKGGGAAMRRSRMCSKGRNGVPAFALRDACGARRARLCVPSPLHKCAFAAMACGNMHPPLRHTHARTRVRFDLPLLLQAAAAGPEGDGAGAALLPVVVRRRERRAPAPRGNGSTDAGASSSDADLGGAAVGHGGALPVPAPLLEGAATDSQGRSRARSHSGEWLFRGRGPGALARRGAARRLCHTHTPAPSPLPPLPARRRDGGEVAPALPYMLEARAPARRGDMPPAPTIPLVDCAWVPGSRRRRHRTPRAPADDEPQVLAEDPAPVAATGSRRHRSSHHRSRRSSSQAAGGAFPTVGCTASPPSHPPPRLPRPRTRVVPLCFQPAHVRVSAGVGCARIDAPASCRLPLWHVAAWRRCGWRLTTPPVLFWGACVQARPPVTTGAAAAAPARASTPGGTAPTAAAEPVTARRRLRPPPTPFSAFPTTPSASCPR